MIHLHLHSTCTLLIQSLLNRVSAAYNLIILLDVYPVISFKVLFIYAARGANVHRSNTLPTSIMRPRQSVPVDQDDKEILAWVGALVHRNIFDYTR